MTPEQCKAARQLLGWTVRRLATEADMSPATIVAFESDAKDTRRRTVMVMRMALERGGVRFTAGSGGAAHPVEVRFSDGGAIRLER